MRRFTMAVATAQQPSTGFPVPDLTPFQKSCLDRIWKSNRRQLVDVRPTSEDCSSARRVVQGHPYRFVVRLHRFFLDFLSQAAEPSIDIHNPDINFLKHPSQSSLTAICHLFFSSSSASNDPQNGEDPSQHPPCQQCRRVLLLHGGRRAVISLAHADFLAELDAYELRGRPQTTEFVQKHSFGAFLYHVPEEALLVASSAVRLAVLTLHLRQNRSTGEGPVAALEGYYSPFLDNSQLLLRFVHVEPVVQMMDIKTSVVGKFLSVRGHVVKTRPKQLRVAAADFSCDKCGAISTHEFVGGRYSAPSSCHNCKSKTFTLLRPTARYQNVQELRLQEAQDESISQAGRTPRQLTVELAADLVDVCRPGDTVLVAATVAAVNTSIQQGRYGKRAQETSTYALYLRGHSVTTLSESSNSASSRNRQQQQQQQNHQQQSVAFTSRQLEAITQLCHADHRYFGMVERRAFPFDLLVRSLCPSIIGHEQVKAGIILSLLGGTPPTSSTKEHSMRCNSHVLIVGYVFLVAVYRLFFPAPVTLA
jgi:hypothetical protein